MVTSVAQDQDQAVCIYFMVACLSGSMKSPLLKERRIFWLWFKRFTNRIHADRV